MTPISQIFFQNHSTVSQDLIKCFQKNISVFVNKFCSGLTGQSQNSAPFVTLSFRKKKTDSIIQINQLLIHCLLTFTRARHVLRFFFLSRQTIYSTATDNASQNHYSFNDSNGRLNIKKLPDRLGQPTAFSSLCAVLFHHSHACQTNSIKPAHTHAGLLDVMRYGTKA